MPETPAPAVTPDSTEQEQNAYQLLTQIPVTDLNTLKQSLELEKPGSVGPTTVARFVDAAEKLGFDLSNQGINAFKNASNLGNSGTLQGVIGPQTASVFYAEFMHRLENTHAPQPAAQPQPQGRRTINAAGIALIKEFEGLARIIPGNRVQTYLDSVGVPTIGYGHTSGVQIGQIISFAQAEAFLQQDLTGFENRVAAMVRVPLTDNQFAALVSLSYNVGSGAVQNSSLIRSLNAGNYADAADRFLRFSFAGGRQLAGLLRRRQAERTLFLTQ